MNQRRPSITRRDFLNGVALSLASGASLAPLDILASGRDGDYYPPRLTGMRGSHVGSFEVAHALAWAGQEWARPAGQTDDDYDLVVVGAGISGLAAANLWRKRAGGNPRILLLDNHDDFGGHAKRNEFDIDGKRLIGYGGSQSITDPSLYSPVARRVVAEAGIDLDRFHDYYDATVYRSRNLGGALHFPKSEYGSDVLTRDVIGRGGTSDVESLRATIATYPISDTSRHAFERLLTTDEDFFADLQTTEKIEKLRAVSYTGFLHEVVGVPQEVTAIFRDRTRGYWGVGWDALSALQACRYRMPATQGLGVYAALNDGEESDDPNIFHFPDGNAGVARALVRQLIPDALPGRDMESLVREFLRYERLDADGSAVRLRLNSTAVDVRHAAGKNAVDVVYIRDGSPQRVRGKRVILACYNHMIPFMCPELPARQAEAIEYAEKVPLVYINVALRNWRAFENLGIRGVTVANPSLMHSYRLDFPISVGGYRFSSGPDEPILVHGTFVPAVPGSGMTAREQHKAGRQQLYQMSFAEFEAGIVEEMQGALGHGGFDAEADIAAITVNRWPHGYAYEYNDYADPPDWGPEKGPHIAGRARIGQISIANSDASAYAFVDGAIDAADRAVAEQLAL